MLKYKKKPVIVEAEQFFVDKKPWPKGVFETFGICVITTTIGHDAKLSDGDWIIYDANGGAKVPKPDIFEQTYERVGADCPRCGLPEYGCDCARKAEEGMKAMGFEQSCEVVK